MKPKFGEVVVNPVASKDNPRRRGLFVRAGRRTGRVMNPGPWWELTDGEGDFWQISPDMCLLGVTCAACFDNGMICRVCGGHPETRWGWCGRGCGSDYNEILPCPDCP